MLVSNGQVEYAPVIAELYRHCFPDKWIESDIRKILALPSTVGWVTEKCFLICSLALDEMEIISIGVLPKYRKMHLGSNLMAELIKFAKMRGVKKIFLEVSIQNQPAINLYQKFGFTQTGIRKNYYHTEDGLIDALNMMKII
ncbi:MAG: ribosomal protein S18-alanine N-acetyltransferase [Pseudomonadota bacterium]|nr:ribosomal protein S18-alanine N-acetyltransferase [Pseudomonadota bacterium]